MAKSVFKWADGKRKTVSSEMLAKKLPDGTVIAWKIDRIELVNPKRDTLVNRRTALGGGQGFSSIQVMPKTKAPGLQRSVYYDLTQLFYMPGDFLHNNGQSVDNFPETFTKNMKKLRAKGFKTVTQAKLDTMLPASFHRSPFKTKRTMGKTRRAMA